MMLDYPHNSGRSQKETDVVVNIDELEDIIELFSDLRQQAIEV